MAYKKEYPVLNDSGAGSLEEYTKRQEDRIESAFKSVQAITSSDNGSVVRFSNGVQIAFISRTSIIRVADPYGNLYRSTDNTRWTFPLPFKGAPVGVVISNLDSKTIGGYAVDVLDNRTGYRLLSAFPQETGTIHFSIFAYGYWK